VNEGGLAGTGDAGYGDQFDDLCNDLCNDFANDLCNDFANDLCNDCYTIDRNNDCDDDRINYYTNVPCIESNTCK
jgi:hypothetical protein